MHSHSPEYVEHLRTLPWLVWHDTLPSVRINPDWWWIGALKVGLIPLDGGAVRVLVLLIYAREWPFAEEEIRVVHDLTFFRKSKPKQGQTS